MATLTASHFVSRTSQVNSHGSSGSETKANLAQMSLRAQAITHHGLRSLNKLDMLQMRTHSKAIAMQAQSKVRNTENDRCAGKIICGQGMNLVFLSAEVGPWSKTGGLGDVLGGLPPAMAVSGVFLLLLVILIAYFAIVIVPVCLLFWFKLISLVPYVCLTNYDV